MKGSVSSNASSFGHYPENMQSLDPSRVLLKPCCYFENGLMRLAAEPSSPVGLLFGLVEALVIDLCGGTGQHSHALWVEAEPPAGKLWKEKKGEEMFITHLLAFYGRIMVNWEMDVYIHGFCTTLSTNNIKSTLILMLKCALKEGIMGILKTLVKHQKLQLETHKMLQCRGHNYANIMII